MRPSAVFWVRLESHESREIAHMSECYVSNHLSSCFSEKRFQWCWPKSADQPSKNPVVRSKSYNIPLLLTPVAEYDPDPSSASSGGIRRHSACEIISCLEEQGLAYADLASGSELCSSSTNRLCVGSQFNGTQLFQMSLSMVII